jgi:hypothetical protein
MPQKSIFFNSLEMSNMCLIMLDNAFRECAEKSGTAYAIMCRKDSNLIIKKSNLKLI